MMAKGDQRTDQVTFSRKLQETRGLDVALKQGLPLAGSWLCP